MEVSNIHQRAATWGYGDSQGLEDLFQSHGIVVQSEKIHPPDKTVISYRPSEDPFLPVARTYFEAREKT